MIVGHAEKVNTSVLFTSDGVAKLADFGLSTVLAADRTTAYSIVGVSSQIVAFQTDEF